MSYSFSKGAYEVRWRDSDGRQRARRFKVEEAAKAFDEAMHDQDVVERTRTGYGKRGGVYPYRTAAGTRWRSVYTRSDGKLTSKRGFTSPTAAATWRRRQIERVERREVVHTKETFGDFWSQWLDRRKPYLEDGTWGAYERDGRIRLLPVLESVRLDRIDVEDVQELMDQMVESLEAGELAPKTINNTLGTLVVCLNDAAKKRRMARNPALEVDKLPEGHVERDYLRLREIPVYLGSCSSAYRPLGETLVGGGVRISEAIGLQIGDLELGESGGIIVIYRSRKKRNVVGSTKSDRFRQVEVGPGLANTLLVQVEVRGAMTDGDRLDAPLFVTPVRVRKRDQGRWEDNGTGGPLDRNTVSQGWHKAALRDADLRDLPLHALRHTAAAAWLAAGNSLKYVQHQLGHADIRTTERYYGHLERSVLAEGAKATEDAIARAVKKHSGGTSYAARRRVAV